MAIGAVVVAAFAVILADFVQDVPLVLAGNRRGVCVDLFDSVLWENRCDLCVACNVPLQ